MGTPTISSNPSSLSSPLSIRSTSPILIESIISTRQRRQNAGNRLRQLLNAEEPLDYEDEDGHNIFQEVEDDDDFDVNASFDEDEDEERDDIDAVENSNDNDDSSAETDFQLPNTKKRQRIDKNSQQSKRLKTSSSTIQNDSDNENNDNDDMFSDSADSISSSDGEDDSAGEKELQRQQRVEARRVARKKRDNSFMPAAVLKAQQRRAKLNQTNDSHESEDVVSSELGPPKPAKKQKLRVSADQLLSENRRRSTRRSAVKNAEDVIQRLQESEARRVSAVFV